MIRTIILSVLALFSAACFAEFDTKAVMDAVSNNNLYEVVSWRKTEKEGSWVADSKDKGLQLGVGESHIGAIQVIGSSAMATMAMVRCFTLSDYIGFKKEDSEAIYNTMMDSITNSRESTVTVSKVRFTSKPAQISNSVLLLCSYDKISG